VLDGDPKTPDALFAVDYTIEGAAVGYKWFDKKGHQPLFAFGHGLSYTTFAYERPEGRGQGRRLTVSFDVKNTGKRTGKAVPQVYVAPKAGGWEAPQAPGRLQEGRTGARRDDQGQPDGRSAPAGDLEREGHGWSVAAGDYRCRVTCLGASSRATYPNRGHGRMRMSPVRRRFC
jgi:beta-glucosidase